MTTAPFEPDPQLAPGEGDDPIPAADPNAPDELPNTPDDDTQTHRGF